MFVIATSGRCATMALASTLDAFSDHEVAHEPNPRLLVESSLKHQGQDYRTDEFLSRMAFFASADTRSYGETFRAPNLLEDIADAAPSTRFLIIIRDPLEYVMSAHSRQVLSKGTKWDRLRLMPNDDSPTRPLAERIASHWVVVNDLLLDFCDRTTADWKVALHGPLEDRLGEWSSFLGVQIDDVRGVEQALGRRINRSESHDRPDGFDEHRLRDQTAATWKRAITAA